VVRCADFLPPARPPGVPAAYADSEHAKNIKSILDIFREFFGPLKNGQNMDRVGTA